MWKQILNAGLLAGSLDITAACINAYLSGKVMPDRLLKFIASGVFGKAAFSGGYGMLAWGLFFHFLIAFSCTIVFFILYPKIPFLRQSHIVNSLCIGIVAWAVTNLIVMPLSHTPKIPFAAGKVAVAIGILVVCIGLPLSILAGRYYKGTR